MQDPQTSPGAPPREHPLGDVLAWPNTPSRRRLDRAAGLPGGETPTPGTPAAQRQQEDVSNYRNHLDSALFSHRAMEELRRERPRLTRRDQLIPLLTRITREADTHSTVGVAMERRTDPRNVTYIFTRMQRHPDWMGFCPLLPNIDGLSAQVIESTNLPGRPGIVLALPHDLAPPPPRARFPRGEAATLESLLRWHGALPAWVPLELARDTPHLPDT